MSGYLLEEILAALNAAVGIFQNSSQCDEIKTNE